MLLGGLCDLWIAFCLCVGCCCAGWWINWTHTHPWRREKWGVEQTHKRVSYETTSQRKLTPFFLLFCAKNWWSRSLFLILLKWKISSTTTNEQAPPQLKFPKPNKVASPCTRFLFKFWRWANGECWWSTGRASAWEAKCKSTNLAQWHSLNMSAKYSAVHKNSIWVLNSFNPTQKGASSIVCTLPTMKETSMQRSLIQEVHKSFIHSINHPPRRGHRIYNNALSHFAVDVKASREATGLWGKLAPRWGSLW